MPRLSCISSRSVLIGLGCVLVFLTAASIFGSGNRHLDQGIRRLGECRIVTDRSTYKRGEPINVSFVVTYFPSKDDRIYVNNVSGEQKRVQGPIYTCCKCSSNGSCRVAFEGSSSLQIESVGLLPGWYTLTIERDRDFTLAMSREFEVFDHVQQEQTEEPSTETEWALGVSQDCSDILNQGSGDSCQVQFFGERVCNDIEFCFGVSQSHQQASFSGCCDSLPGCNDARHARGNLGLLKRLSIADFSFSLLVVLVSACKCGSLVPPTGILIIFFEFLDFCFSAGIIAAGFSQDLILAECFTNVGNEQVVSDFRSEIDDLRAVAYAELFMSLVAMVLHWMEVARAWDREDYVSVYFFLCWIVDLIELILAGVGLFIFLIPAINSFEFLYMSMLRPPETIGPLDPVPCILSNCA